MKRAFLLFVCFFAFVVPSVALVASDPYKSLQELPSENSTGTQKGSPYESLSTIPDTTEEERYETMQNEYSAPGGS